MKSELSGFKEKTDPGKKPQHASKKSEQGNSKLVKDNHQTKGVSYFLSVQKKGLLKPKGIVDSLLKEQPSLVVPKRSHGATDLREKSKESTKSKDFGKLLKKVTNSLYSRFTSLTAKVDSRLLKTKRSVVKKKTRHNSMTGGCSFSSSGTSRTADHILEVSGFSVEPKAAKFKCKTPAGEYALALNKLKANIN